MSGIEMSRGLKEVEEARTAGERGSESLGNK